MSNTQQDNRILMLGNQVYQSVVSPLIQQIISYNMYDDEMESKQKGYERKPIKLIINSYGGSPYDGWGLVGAIESSVTPIITILMGSAMSMALPIFLAGHQRVMHKYSVIMYHEVRGFTDGELTTVKESIDEWVRLQDMYDDYIISKTKVMQEKFDAVRERKIDWYIDAAEAIKYGFVGEGGVITDAVTWTMGQE